MEASGRGSLSELPESELEYLSVEPWAVMGLLLGVLSPVALLGGVWWLVPLTGIVVSLIALGRMHSEAGRSGRIVALAGLCLALAFGIAPGAKWISAQWLLKYQARPLADQFMEYLRQDHPEKALMLRVVPDFRLPLDDDEGLWVAARNDRDNRAEMQRFVQDPVIRTLLALGERSQVRFYRASNVVTEGPRALVEYQYTVTFDDEDGKKKTFLVGLLLERWPDVKNDSITPWRVKDYSSASASAVAK